MKVFRVDRPNETPLHFYNLTSLRAYLTAHPEILEIEREWWSRNDFIDSSTFTRDEIFRTKASKLKAGATIQWAASHE